MLGLHSINILLVQSGKNKRLTPNHQGPSPELSVTESDAIDLIMCIILRKINLEEKNWLEKNRHGQKMWLWFPDSCFALQVFWWSRILTALRMRLPWKTEWQKPAGQKANSAHLTFLPWQQFSEPAWLCCLLLPYSPGLFPCLTSVNTDRANYLWVGVPTSIWTNSL